MKQALMLVEGQTEERIVDECLRPYLEARGVFVIPTIVTTRKTVGGVHRKGGVQGYGRVKRDLQRLLGHRGVSVVTTMLDYYALPMDFPGMAGRPAQRDPRARVEHVEAAWGAEVGDRRFVPHIVLHELEAWVFADPSKLAPRMFNDDHTVVAAITAIARKHATPEDIDEGRDTAPSKRLERVFPPYQKTLHGVEALKAIGPEGACQTCPPPPGSIGCWRSLRHCHRRRRPAGERWRGSRCCETGTDGSGASMPGSRDATRGRQP